jgi:3-deoxy-D-manno-octulosonic-acid transferase
LLVLWNLLLALGWPLLYLYRPFRGTVPLRLGRGLPDWRRRSPGRSAPGEARPAASAPAPGAAAGGSEDGTPAPTILVNAVSAGEVAAVAPFVRELKQRRPGCRIALLTTTDSGLELARRRLGEEADLTAYFPLLDLPWVSRRYLDLLQPDVYITTESELWPNIQRQCQARGIPVVSLNARLYLHNKTGLRGALIRRLYSYVDRIICQSEFHRANFIRFGIPAEKLAVSGNLKFDTDIPAWTGAHEAAWRAELGLVPGLQCIVAGSTHPAEEELVFAAYLDIRNRLVGLGRPAPRLIIAPRHIERVPDVLERAAQSGLQAARLAQAASSDWQVLLADRYGVLVDLYRVAAVVILGGTFDPKVGGHNVLEATALGKPVVVGPHVYSIAAQVEQLDAAVALSHAAGTSAGLAEALAGLLADPAQAAALGQRALAVTEAARGAAGRAADLVLPLLDGPAQA